MPLLPVGMYGLEVPPGGVLVPALPEFSATFRITMAAIDPDEEVDAEGTRPRATLRIIQSTHPDEEDDDDYDDEMQRAMLAGSSEDESESESDSDDEEVNGGPSDPAKSKKARREAALNKLIESVQSDSDEDMEDATSGINGVKVDRKGKGKATSDDEESEEESDGEELDVKEYVLCTLDPEKNFQQPIDITIPVTDQVFFAVSGTHTVYLTGNYVVSRDEGHNHIHEIYSSDKEEDEDYDLSPDEDELELEMDDDESDELDELEDPRITEINTDEEEAPQLVARIEAKSEKKGKNKRSADEITSSATLDDIMEKSLKPEPAATEEPKLSKKQLKKLKKNNGEAMGVKTEEDKNGVNIKKEDPKADKKVQFAKNLEQGPSPRKTEDKAKSQSAVKTEEKVKSQPVVNGKATSSIKNVNGVQIEDKKDGRGPACKKGDRVTMRYIGKLTDGRVFDANKKGKPFGFKLGSGEVIKGWDIGVVGMSVGGERRLNIPSNLAYGSKSQPGIPGNSTLVFDIKLLEIK